MIRNNNHNNSNARDEERIIDDCIRTFYRIATLQGRIAYLLMSIHAVNPAILNRLLHNKLHQILWYNMLYGTTIHLYSRPNMRPVNPGHRICFSILGSLMFNYSAMRVFGYFAQYVEERPYLMTFLGFLAGRAMIVQLLAYLYHVDSRSGTVAIGDHLFDSIYS